MLYRALPHREGGGVPRDIATGHYNREAVRAQLRRELQYIRNVDTFFRQATGCLRVQRIRVPHPEQSEEWERTMAGAHPKLSDP
jgi:hypothetical protein